MKHQHLLPCIVALVLFATHGLSAQTDLRPGRVDVTRDPDGTLRPLPSAPHSSLAQMPAVPDDVHWDPRFFDGGLGLGLWSVNAIEVTPTKIYVGGLFSEINGVAANNVAVYDRASGTWSALADEGGNGTTGTVMDILVDGDDVYVAGRFLRAGGVGTGNVARWNGSEWRPVGSGMDAVHTVQALAMYRDHLYAAGSFSILGGVTDVARLDGFSWKSIGISSTLFTFDLAVYNDELLVSGMVLRAGDSLMSPLLAWDGVRWRTMNANIENYDAVRRIVATTTGDLYVTGSFWNDSLDGVARWNGSTWSSPDRGIRRNRSGLQPNVDALAIGPGGEIAAGGHYIDSAGARAVHDIALYANGAWSDLGGGVRHGVNAIAFDGTDLIVGGQFTQAGGVAAHGIARWNGSTWTELGRVHRPGGAVYEIAGAGTSDVIVGGAFNTAGGIGVNNIARFDGTTWTPLGAGVNNVVQALHVDDGGTVYAAAWQGAVTRAGSAPVENFALWNGSEWSAHPVPFMYTGQIFAITSNRTGLYVGGTGINIGETQSALARWDGERWSDVGGLGTSILDGRVTPLWVIALAAHGDDIYAGGDFDTSSSGDLSNVARWNGTSWDPLDGGVGTNEGDVVQALAIWRGDLVVAGSFSGAGGIAARGLARYDLAAGQWEPTPDLNGIVHDVAVVNDELFISGIIGAQVLNNVTRFDGTTYHPLGSGINNIGYAIEGDRLGRIYVGGPISRGGDKDSYGIARWNGVTLGIGDEMTGHSLRASASPNPAVGASTLAYTLERGARVRIALVDALGAELQLLQDGVLPAGEHAATVDATRLAPGAYFLRIAVDGAVSTLGVSVVR